MGTPTYMSPEQCRGTGNVDHRADLYSLGCIFYEMVCGRPPFEDEGAGELIGAHLYVQPDPPRTHRPDLSEAANQLIVELLSKKPEGRPQTAKELGQRLGRLAESNGWITHTNPAGVPLMSSTKVENVPAGRFEEVANTEPVPVAAPSDAMAAPVPAHKPTTLSLAASQSVLGLQRSRRGLVLGLGGALAVAAAAVVVLVAGRGSKDDHAPAAVPISAPAPAATPAAPPTTAATATTPTSAPTPPVVAEPTPPATPPPAVQPTVTATPPVAAPSTPATATPPPHVSTSAHGAVPKASSAPAKTRPTSAPAQAAKATGSGAGTGSGKGSGSGKILIETDL